MAETESILDPHHSREHGRMILRAINGGWWGPSRWPTGVSKTDVDAAIAQRGGGATLKEKAVLAAFELMEAGKRSKGIGAKIVGAMEKQNQADEHHADGQYIHHDHTIETADKRRSRLAALATRLGIGGVASNPAATPAIGHPESANGSQHRNGEANGKPV